MAKGEIVPDGIMKHTRIVRFYNRPSPPWLEPGPHLAHWRGKPMHSLRMATIMANLK